MDKAILRFDLFGGTLPSDLLLNSSTRRISGIVGGVRGSFYYTVRVSAECFTGLGNILCRLDARCGELLKRLFGRATQPMQAVFLH